jgi:uncharacterized protein YndB with AHSA1/START domain
MFKILCIGFVAIVVILAIVIALQPSAFRITRSSAFDAPPGAVFEQVNNFHNWNEWSPWARIDPNARYTFTGPEVGPGSSLAWAGNNQVGEGRMTITDSRPDERVVMKLEFLKPFTATHAAEFTFTPEGEQTRMTWSMSGKNNFLGKTMSLVMNCEKMIGGQFEQGFANLRSIVESQGRLTAAE